MKPSLFAMIVAAVLAVVCDSAAQPKAAELRYSVSIAPVNSPDGFQPLAEVNLAHPGGATEVRIGAAGETPVVRHAAAVRCEFGDGALGFNVYREFVITGKPGPK